VFHFHVNQECLYWTSFRLCKDGGVKIQYLLTYNFYRLEIEIDLHIYSMHAILR
jgi:hypothetical protein